MKTSKIFISFIYKSDNIFNQVLEENYLKNKIGKLLKEKGYKFVIGKVENEK